MNNNSDLSKISKDQSTLKEENQKIFQTGQRKQNIHYAEFKSEDSVKTPNSQNDLENKKTQVKNNFKKFFKKVIFKYRKNASFKVDSVKILYYGLGALSLEYLIYLIFQIISLIALQDFFSNWIIGVVLFLIYIPVLCVGIYLVNNKYYFSSKILKIFEFLIYLFFLGWCAGYFGFEGVGLSYVILINFLLVFLFVF